MDVLVKGNRHLYSNIIQILWQTIFPMVLVYRYYHIVYICFNTSHCEYGNGAGKIVKDTNRE